MSAVGNSHLAASSPATLSSKSSFLRLPTPRPALTACAGAPECPSVPAGPAQEEGSGRHGLSISLCINLKKERREGRCVGRGNGPALRQNEGRGGKTRAGNVGRWPSPAPTGRSTIQRREGGLLLQAEALAPARTFCDWIPKDGLRPLKVSVVKYRLLNKTASPPWSDAWTHRVHTAGHSPLEYNNSPMPFDPSLDGALGC